MFIYKDMTKKISVCSRELFPYIPSNGQVFIWNELETYYSSFQDSLKLLGCIVKEGGPTSIFISHAWHYQDCLSSNCKDENTLKEAKYYDKFCFEIFLILRCCGFDVYFDRDSTNPNNIAAVGTKKFMEKIRDVDIVISICTPAYRKRSLIPSGVQEEVNHIKSRSQEKNTLQFYVPLLVHVEDCNYSPKELLVGEDDMYTSAVWIDFRDSSTFISNIWLLLHRIWSITALKWQDSNVSVDLHRRFLESFSFLLTYEDYMEENTDSVIQSEKRCILLEMQKELSLTHDITSFEARNQGTAHCRQQQQQLSEMEELFLSASQYEKGSENVLPNLWQAKELYKQAAQLGHTISYYRLGLLCLEIYNEIHEGIAYLKLACDRGCADAEWCLSNIYRTGQYGISVDLSLWLHLLIRASLHGHIPAKEELLRNCSLLNLNAEAPFRVHYKNLLSYLSSEWKLSQIDLAEFISCNWDFHYLLWLLYDERSELISFQFLYALQNAIFSEDIYRNRYQQTLLHKLLEDWNDVNDPTSRWYADLFDFLLEQLDHTNLELLDGEGRSYLDIAAATQNTITFKALAIKGCGKILSPAIIFQFYKELFLSDHETLELLKPLFIRLENRNQSLKFYFALEFILGEFASKDSLSSITIQGVSSKVLHLPTCVFDGTVKGFRILRMNKEGRATVAIARHHHYSLYLKFLPELPGIENAVGNFSDSLVGFGTSIAEIFRVNEVIEVPIFRSSQVLFTNVSDLVKLENIPVLISLGIDGPLLKDIYVNNDIENYKLDDFSLFCSILISMIINPEDAKSDNFVLEMIPPTEDDHNDSTRLPLYRLICIDNDHSFVPPLVEVIKGKAKMNTRSILYVFDQINKPIPSTVFTIFENLDVDGFLRTWLRNCRQLNDRYSLLFPDTEQNNLLFTKYHCFLGIPFAKDQISHLYTKLSKLKQISHEVLTSGRQIEEESAGKASNPMTPLSLFLVIEPSLKGRYEDVFHKYSLLSIQERFRQIEGESAMKTLSRPLDILTSYRITNTILSRTSILHGKEYSPGQATDELEEIIEQSFHFDLMQSGQFDSFHKLKRGDHIEKIIEHCNFRKLPIVVNNIYLGIIIQHFNQYQIHKLFLDYHPTVQFKHFTQITYEGFQRLTHLSLKACPGVNSNMVAHIARNATVLVFLDLSGCPNLKALRNNASGILSSSLLPLTFCSLTFLDISNCVSLETVNIKAPKLEHFYYRCLDRLALLQVDALRLKIDKRFVYGPGKILIDSKVKILTSNQFSFKDEKCLLGSGTISRVYKGRKYNSDIDYAIKVIFVMEFSEEVKQRVAKEANMLSLIQNPHVVGFFGLLSPKNSESSLFSVYEGPSVALILEYCQFGSLSDLIRGWEENSVTHFPLTFSYLDKLRLCLGAALGLTAVHSIDRHTCYVDVRATSFLVNSDFTVKISGTALEQDGTRFVPDHLHERWLAPETISTKQCSQSSDIYSLGIVFWEIFSGGIPYENVRDPASVRDKIVSGCKLPLIDPSFSPSIHDLIRSCWETDPQLRPPATTICETLQQMIKSFLEERLGLDSFKNSTSINNNKPSQYLDINTIPGPLMATAGTFASLRYNCEDALAIFTAKVPFEYLSASERFHRLFSNFFRNHDKESPVFLSESIPSLPAQLGNPDMHCSTDLGKIADLERCKSSERFWHILNELHLNPNQSDGMTAYAFIHMNDVRTSTYINADIEEAVIGYTVFIFPLYDCELGEELSSNEIDKKKPLCYAMLFNELRREE